MSDIHGVKPPALPPGESSLSLVSGGFNQDGEGTVLLTIGRPITEETSADELVATHVMLQRGAIQLAKDLLEACLRNIDGETK